MMKIDLLTTIEERAGVRGEALPSIELPQMGGAPLRFLPEIKAFGSQPATELSQKATRGVSRGMDNRYGASCGAEAEGLV